MMMINYIRTEVNSCWFYQKKRIYIKEIFMIVTLMSGENSLFKNVKRYMLSPNYKAITFQYFLEIG